jgi:spore coat protein U-like protein
MQIRPYYRIYIAVMCFLSMMTAAGAAYAANPSILPAAITDPVEFIAWSQVFTASGSVGIYNWSISAGALPAGLSFVGPCTNTNTCTISGTPVVSGAYSFTLMVTDVGTPPPPLKSGTRTYSGTINPRCRFSGLSTGSIQFDSTGLINPTLAGPITNSVITQVNFQCGPGTTYSFNPVTPNLSGALNTIPFTLGLAAAGLNVTDATLVPLLTTTSQMTQANYQNARAETDTSGNITVTINWTGAAAGSMNATVTASGTVQNVCTVTGSPALNFGAALDAVTNAGGAAAAVTPPALKCTTGDSVTVLEDYGVNKLGTQHRLKSGANYINYNFGFSSPLSGAGGTLDIGGSGAGHLAMDASIPAGALNNAPAGTYTDTITLTISY